jgi:hypothetical protein
MIAWLRGWRRVARARAVGVCARGWGVEGAVEGCAIGALGRTLLGIVHCA